MYQRLSEETLKSGERLEVGVVVGPDAEWRPRLAPFLGHKNADYRAHIEGALDRPLGSLQTRFYVGRIGERLVAQVMIVGDRGAGILAHVYTVPEERRKGAASAIFAHLIDDCRRAGFGVLCLGTGFESPPYWIYHSHGFRSVAPGSGCMKWLAHPHAEETIFAPGSRATVRPLQWGDWGYLDLLCLQPLSTAEELPRCPTLGVKGQSSAEGPFVQFQWRREREPRIQAQALVSHTGATVGWAILSPDPRWYRNAWLLDVHTHPGFTAHLPELLRSVEVPSAPVAAYLTAPRGPKAAALQDGGFRETASLPRWIEEAGERRDLSIWSRSL